MKVRVKLSLAFDTNNFQQVAFFKAFIRRFQVNAMRCKPREAMKVIAPELYEMLIQHGNQYRPPAGPRQPIEVVEKRMDLWQQSS